MAQAMKKIFIVFLVMLSLWAVYRFAFTSFKTTYAFYHWQSTYAVNEKHPPKYVKVLDIAFNNSLAVQKTIFKTKVMHKIVPVVYMDNALWSKMKPQIMVLKVLTALKTMPILYEEIQIDCDWTGSSKAKYFEFLSVLKKQSHKKISATIRLHQVKYYDKTGVPPIDYGVLMYYNMSDFKDLKTKNYILDLEIAKRYHYNFESYPLRLNLALPLYAQATIIRFGEVVGIMEGVRERSLDKNFKKIKMGHYKIMKTHYFQGRLLYEGDIIRVDEVSKSLLKKSVVALRKVMPQPREIIFYRWGNKTFYGEDFLFELSDEFS